MIKSLMSNLLVTTLFAFIGTSAAIETYAASNPEFDPLIITAVFAEQILSSKSTIEFVLNRPILNTEGALAVFIGTTDITDMLERSGLSWKYRPSPLLLPEGESKVTVYLVSPNREWREIVQLPLRVATNQSQQNQPGGKKNSFAPSLTISTKSQPAIWRSPNPLLPERTTFTDFTLQGNVRMNIQHRSFGWQSEFDVVGSSYKPEELRYGLLNNKAPNIDLSSYRMAAKLGSVSLNAGHLTYGSNKHLINEFPSRGL